MLLVISGSCTGAPGPGVGGSSTDGAVQDWVFVPEDGAQAKPCKAPPIPLQSIPTQGFVSV